MNEITIRIYCERCKRSNCICQRHADEPAIPWHDIDVERVIANMPEHVRFAFQTHINTKYNER